nr:hypothetical protein [Bosea sp. REN20]
MPLDFLRLGGIIICFPAMLAAVDLDDQLSVNADEIDGVAEQGNLSAELQPVELAITQERPEDVLRFGGAPSKVSSKLPLFGCHLGRC